MLNKFSRHLFAGPVALLVAIGPAASIAQADDIAEIEKAVEYRQGVMNILAWNTKTISGMLKGKTEYDAETIKTAAKDIASTASLDIIAGFPEDSEHEDSAALADIWLDFENFEQKMADFQKAADNLNVASQTGDKMAVGNAMKDLGKTCKGCHKPFKN